MNKPLTINYVPDCILQIEKYADELQKMFDSYQKRMDRKKKQILRIKKELIANVVSQMQDYRIKRIGSDKLHCTQIAAFQIRSIYINEESDLLVRCIYEGKKCTMYLDDMPFDIITTIALRVVDYIKERKV